MKIILPMAGSTPEFEKVFGTAKPLVNIKGMTILEFVCNMFPGKPDLVLLYRKNDMDKYGLELVLNNVSHGDIQLIAVDNTTKNVLETIILADGSIGEDEEILVVHCDSYSRFDYSGFLTCVRSEGAEGALTAFTGFSPFNKKNSNLGRIGIKNGYVAEIFEKKPLKTGQLTAAGCYYFYSWKLFRKYVQKMMEQQHYSSIPIFVSEVYNEMLKDGKKVIYYVVDSFINFESPKDVKEFIYWSEVFSNIKSDKMKGDGHEEHNASCCS